MSRWCMSARRRRLASTRSMLAYTGTVSYIAPEATSNGTTRSYLVRIDLGQQDGLRSGMQVTVDLDVN